MKISLLGTAAAGGSILLFVASAVSLLASFYIMVSQASAVMPWVSKLMVLSFMMPAAFSVVFCFAYWRDVLKSIRKKE